MKKARDVSYGQKTLGSLILKAQKSFIHEKWQGRESKIRTISREDNHFVREVKPKGF